MGLITEGVAEPKWNISGIEFILKEIGEDIKSEGLIIENYKNFSIELIRGP